MKTKKYLLFSSWYKYNPNFVLARIKKIIPEFIAKNFNQVVIEEKLVSNTWAESFRLGIIGKKVTGYYYYVEMNLEALNEKQIVVMDGFWVGFLAGRDSKPRNSII